MAQLSLRSFAMIAGLLLLGACADGSWFPWSGDGGRGRAPSQRPPTAVPDPDRSPAPRSPSSLATLFRTLIEDDETAVDAREVPARRSGAVPRTGGGSPPKVNVLYVSNGRIRAYGSHVIVRGIVSDDDGEVVEVTVNGKLASLKDRSFSRRLPAPMGETEVVVRAEDEDGNVATARFMLVRSLPGQRLAVQRPTAQELSNPEYRYIDSPLPAAPRLEDVAEPGVYMILLAGTPSAHFVKMPSLAQCREAVEYTENAACAFHRGRE